ncbi:MAG: AAC(3) family N-acetyltransferase [Bdellovibrionales bacterium]|nr:AAC(3) family N-acetyltransferase [Bdellovibrionales bacterium]
MNEKAVVEKSTHPLSGENLVAAWNALGLRPGATVLVHSSLSSLGWVCGGAVTVIQSLMEVLTPEGTLVMPAHTAENSEPSYWCNPAVPRSWWPTIRDSMPPFDPQWTPTRGMGVVAEVFRTLPGVVRSQHPMSSFCAWGKCAREMIAQHSLSHPFGEQSPLSALYKNDGLVLMVGVDWNSNTSLHLAEERAGGYNEINQASAIWQQGQRKWVGFVELESKAELFPLIGRDFETQTHQVITRQVGLAPCRLMPQRSLVDFAVEWIRRQPSPPPGR